MLRTLILSAALIGVSAPALAGHPDPDTPRETVKTLPQLPSEAEIEDIMASMPDMNAIMGDMMKMMSDPKVQKGMRRAGEKLEQKMERSGAMEMQDNGLPDFNAAMGAMLSMMSDEEVMGSMMGMMGAMTETMEKHVPEAGKPLE